MVFIVTCCAQLGMDAFGFCKSLLLCDSFSTTLMSFGIMFLMSSASYSVVDIFSASLNNNLVTPIDQGFSLFRMHVLVKHEQNQNNFGIKDVWLLLEQGQSRDPFLKWRAKNQKPKLQLSIGLRQQEAFAEIKTCSSTMSCEEKACQILGVIRPWQKIGVRITREKLLLLLCRQNCHKL